MELLHGNQRKILKIIYKAHKKNKFVTKNELSKKINLDFKEITNLCEDLCNKKLISLGGPDRNPKITSYGLEYFSIETITNIETCITSIACPIIVSFLTTLITLLLQGLL